MNDPAVAQSSPADLACGNCRFFLAFRFYGDDRGFCRRYPPSSTAFDLNFRALSISEDAAQRFPSTFDANWCGEWDGTRPGEPIR